MEGRKGWQCAECGFERNKRYDVARHVEQKHLNLVIPCDYCTATFTRRDKLRAHLKNKHDII